jgi:hypothetical protein
VPRSCRTLLLLAVSICSCHWVLPFDRVPGSSDAPARDRPASDRRSERGPGEVTRRDLSPDRTCVLLEQDALTQTTCPVPSCSAGQDCDGLPDLRDPYPTCNPVVWSESFSQATWPAAWGRSYCSDDMEAVGCGQMQFRFPENYTLAVWKNVQIAATDVVETRFHLVASSSIWLTVTEATLKIPTWDGDDACFQYSVEQRRRACWVDYSDGSLTLGGMVLGNAEHSPAQRSDIPPPASGWLVLQSYVTGTKHICRVYSESQQLDTLLVDFAGDTVGQGATVMVTGVNTSLDHRATVEVDWVRAFSASF